jgi:hypothetical protein
MGTYSEKRFIFLVLTTIMLVTSSCSTFLPQPTPTLTVIASTETPVSSFTPTVSSTPVPSITPSPPSTKTSTPQPGWVTEFAQPILSVIVNRTPSFQDDFGAGSAGWTKDYCEGSMKYIEGELVATKCRFYRPNTDWRDFVLEVDMRFLEGTPSSGEWALHFRDLGNSGHSLTLYHSGYLAIDFTKAKGASSRIEFDRSAFSNDQIHHILLIAKGNQFAFYLDSQPLYYARNDEYRFGRCVFYVESGTVAMDNFRIWNIADIQTP